MWFHPGTVLAEAPAKKLPYLLVPFAVYLALVLLLGDWVIDDAGISYAYARNAALGHGFVSQPGRPPVEGFSNFLWVVLLAPFFVLDAFDPVVVPKLLGAGCVLAALALVQRTLRRETGSERPGLVVALLAAAAPPIAIWSSSGLENGLTLLLVAALYATMVERPKHFWARAGVLAALLGMTRPDGLVFLGSGALLAVVDLVRGERSLRRAALGLLANTAAAAAVLGPFLRYRLWVFGHPFPHPYYAKRYHMDLTDRVVEVFEHPGEVFTKLLELLRAAWGPGGPAIVALMVAGAVLLAVRRRLARAAEVALSLWAIAVGGFLFLDPDWMGEHRFGTASLLLTFTSCVAVAVTALDHRLRVPVSVLGVALAYASFVPRFVAFARNPPTSFADVDRGYTHKLHAYADLLGVRGGSVFLPDVGAMLYGSKLTVYDAAGLCEPDVVRTLKHDTPVWLPDRTDFHDYVFERLRPTFIATHHFWTFVAAFDRDPRFARDYLAIDAYVDGYVKNMYGVALRSGDFVRRDAITDMTRVTALHERYHAPPRPDPPVVRLLERARRLWSGEESIVELREAAKAALPRDPNRAATLYGRILERLPQDLEAAFGRAAALDAAARPDEAHAEWERVAKLAGASPSGGIARARLGGRAR